MVKGFISNGKLVECRPAFCKCRYWWLGGL